MDALAPPPLVVPPLLVVPLPMEFLLPLSELMLTVAITPLGAIILLVIKT
jgi:hypothetical protein